MPVMTTTMDPAAEAPRGDDGASRIPVPPPAGAPLWVACLLLGLVFAGGAVLAFEPGQNGLDSWGFSIFPNVLQNEFLRLMSNLGRAPVTIGVSLVAGAVVWRRDRRRTLACLAGPGLAVAMAELLKLIVGRRFEGALCWPSGTTAAVTAAATAVVLVLRGKGRGAAVVVGSAVGHLRSRRPGVVSLALPDRRARGHRPGRGLCPAGRRRVPPDAPPGPPPGPEAPTGSPPAVFLSPPQRPPATAPGGSRRRRRDRDAGWGEYPGEVHALTRRPAQRGDRGPR